MRKEITPTDVAIYEHPLPRLLKHTSPLPFVPWPTQLTLSEGAREEQALQVSAKRPCEMVVDDQDMQQFWPLTDWQRLRGDVLALMLDREV